MIRARRAVRLAALRMMRMRYFPKLTGAVMAAGLFLAAAPAPACVPGGVLADLGEHLIAQSHEVELVRDDHRAG